MKKYKENVSIILLVIIIVLSIMYFWLGFFPIYGKIMAVSKLSKYTGSLIYKVSFDWLNSKYVYYFDDGSRLTYRLPYNSIFDERTLDEINDKANRQYQLIKSSFPANLTLPESIDLSSEINADDYTQKSQMLYLSGISNTEKLTEAQSLEMPAKIVRQFIELMGDEYSFTGIQFGYYDKNGVYELIIRYGDYQLLKHKNLEKSVRKYSENEWGLDYIEWLKQHSD